MLGQSDRRWPNIKAASDQRPVFAYETEAAGLYLDFNEVDRIRITSNSKKP